MKTYINYITGEELDITILDGLEDNKLIKYKPFIWEIWDFNKNKNQNVLKVTIRNTKKLWAICPTCKESYLRMMKLESANTDCKKCNSLKVKYPSIYNQLHLEENDMASLELISYGSKRVVTWIGECGHIWKSNVKRRTVDNEGCPYCNGKKLLIGFNDMWTTNPQLASKLLNPNDGYKYRQNSNSKIDWKCPNCNLKILNKQIAKVNLNGLSCQRCSDGFSFGEKVMTSILRQLDLSFEFEKSFKWSAKKRYDFYIPSTDTIIEVHGIQHYKQSLFHVNGVSITEQVCNDEYKRNLATSNSIVNYIEIDSRHSDLVWIKNSILNSELAKLYNLDTIDWKKVLLESENSYMIECLDYWNNGYKSVSEIVNETGLSEFTVRKYLKLLTQVGLCDYFTNKDLQKKIIRKE